MSATEQFIQRHYTTHHLRPGTNVCSTHSDTQYFLASAQRAGDENRSKGPGAPGTKDQARRHMTWLMSMAYLRKLADDRANGR